MSVMKLPANYAVINEEEMVYLDGGACVCGGCPGQHHNQQCRFR